MFTIFCSWATELKNGPEMCCTEHNDVTVELTFELLDIKCHHFITSMNSWGRTKNVFHASQWTWPLTKILSVHLGQSNKSGKRQSVMPVQVCRLKNFLRGVRCFAGGWDLDVYCRWVVWQKQTSFVFQRHIELKLNNTFPFCPGSWVSVCREPCARQSCFISICYCWLWSTLLCFHLVTQLRHRCFKVSVICLKYRVGLLVETFTLEHTYPCNL